MVKWISLVCLFFCAPSFAHDIFDLKDVQIVYHHYSDSSRTPLVTQNGLPDRHMGTGVDLLVNMDLMSYLYWDNTVHTISDVATSGGGQNRTVSWEYRLGVRVTEELSVGYFHHSQHILDFSYHSPLPLEDAFEIRFTIFKSKSHDTVF